MDDRMKKFINQVIMNGEDLTLNSFPGKIDKLNELLKSPEWNYKDLTVIHSKPNIPIPEPIVQDGVHNEVNKKRKLSFEEHEGTKVYEFPNGPVSTNLIVFKLINVVKPVLRELMDDTNALKMWLTFMIPKIEDGNNFGVSVQEDTLAEIQTVEAEANTSYEGIHRYFIARAKIISKVAKYPHITDYRLAVNELDEKQYISLRLMLRETQNRYAVLNDIVVKNLDKIKHPRSSNSVSLY